MGGRFQLPAEFYDITDAMLLVQPEPQYLYAQMWLGAFQTDLAAPDTVGLPFRPIGGVGADYSSAERDRLKLANPMFSEVIAAKLDFNAKPGNTIRVNRPVFATSTPTEATRRVLEGTSISTTPVSFGSEQTSITLFRYGGPYDTTNSRVAPYPVEGFSSSMGVHNIAKLVGTQLRRDCHRFIDFVCRDLLDLASTAVYPDGMSAVNDATYTGQFPLTLEQVTRVEEAADTANLPTFNADGFRALSLTPTQIRQLKNDPQFRNQSAFHKEYNVLFPGVYEFSIGKLHVFKNNTLSVTNNSSSVAVHYGHLIAPGALLAGMGRPLRVTSASDDNYGETAKVIWLGDLAFGLADSRFSISVRSSA